MVVKLDLYHVFCQVGKKGSLSKAAKQLYMTQPAVSQAIMQLERELDIRLFHRTPKGVTFTKEGGILYDYVKSALHILQSGEEKLDEFKNLTVGELTIGVGDTISKHFLLPFLETFHNQYPNIKFKIANGTTLEISELLKSGVVDIGICNFPVDNSMLHQIPCLPVHDCFVCGNDLKQHFKEPVTLEEIANWPLILLEPKSVSRRYVEHYLSGLGIAIEPEFELGSHDLLLEFAKINLGIACVTKEFSEGYLANGSVHEIQLVEAIPKRSVGICYLKSVPLSKAASIFVEIVENNR